MVEAEQEQCGTCQLEQGDSGRRDGTCQQVCYGTDILLHTVEHITGMEGFATAPMAFQNMFKQILPQPVAQADFRVCIKAVDK